MLNWFHKESNVPKTLGKLGEELAQLYYKNRGYKVIAANFFNRKGKQLGEVDFIACNKDTVVFVEVKTRTEEKGFHGTPAEAVDYFKQVKILKAVKVFLLKQPKFQKFRPQIDVAAVIINDFSLLERVEGKPVTYLPKVKLDKLPHSVTILANAVEDWG